MKLHHLVIFSLTLLASVPPALAANAPSAPVEKTAPAHGHAEAEPPADGKVHLNSAGAEQLQTLKGVGPSTAQAILDWREQYGPFKSVDQLLAVKGIGPKTLAGMREHLAL